MQPHFLLCSFVLGIDQRLQVQAQHTGLRPLIIATHLVAPVVNPASRAHYA